MASKISKGKASPAKKASAKKAVVAKNPVPEKKADKPPVKRVPPRIIKKVAPLKPVEEYTPIDTEKAVAFARSIAMEMKRAAANESAPQSDTIKLSRRPTTRMQGKETVKFPAADLKMFKKRLVEARVQALSGVSAMKATGFNESDDHETDGGDGTAQTLRLQALGHNDFL